MGFPGHSCNNGARFSTAFSEVNHRRALCFRSSYYIFFSPPELRIQREEEEEDDEEEDKDRQSLANTVQDIEEEQGQRSVIYNSTFTVYQQHALGLCTGDVINHDWNLRLYIKGCVLFLV